jgi:broad specificity phosphatase PhoE
MDLKPGQFSSRKSTKLYLIRHAEVEEKYQTTNYGQLDVDLSRKGKEMSGLLVERLSDIPFDVIYSSDLKRAAYLADLLAEPRNLPVRRLEVFRERSFGELQGMQPVDLEGEQLEHWQKWIEDKVHYRVPGSETWKDLHDRVIPSIEELIASFRGRRILVVCHGGTIRATLAWALGVPLANVYQIHQAYCAVNVIEFHPDQPPKITLVNG